MRVRPSPALAFSQLLWCVLAVAAPYHMQLLAGSSIVCVLLHVLGGEPLASDGMRFLRSTPCLCMWQALFEACVEAGDAAMVAGQEEYEALRAAALWWLNTHPQVWNSPAELLQALHLCT